MGDKPKVKLELEAPIARVVLDRPEKLNALDPQMLGELEGAIDQAEQSAGVRVMILESAGEKGLLRRRRHPGLDRAFALGHVVGVGAPGPPGL